MTIEKFLEATIQHILTITPEGMLLYVCGATTMTWVHLHHRKEVIVGLKGENGLWEGPEWVLYVCSWLFPHAIMADLFLGLKSATDWPWWLLISLLMYGLTGRFGLQWLLALKSGSSKVEESTTIVNKTTTKEESQ